MDIDYVLKKPLQDVIDHIDADKHLSTKGAFVNETPNSFLLRRLSNSMMLSREPGHEFWMHAMRMAHNGKGLSSHQQILTGTGPQLIDSAYRKWHNKQQVAILPKRYFNPCSLCSRGSSCSKSAEVIAYHGNDGCWNSKTSHMYNNVYCNIWWVVFAVLMFIVIITLAVLLAKRH